MGRHRRGDPVLPDNSEEAVTTSRHKFLQDGTAKIRDRCRRAVTNPSPQQHGVDPFSVHTACSIGTAYENSGGISCDLLIRYFSFCIRDALDRGTTIRIERDRNDNRARVTKADVPTNSHQLVGYLEFSRTDPFQGLLSVTL